MLQYAKELAKFVAEEKIPNLKVWTSELRRTIQTAQYIQAPKAHWKALNEIDAVSYKRHLQVTNIVCIMPVSREFEPKQRLPLFP